ncbi:MAG: MOSC domain-containing protein, partial [Crocinitomicaceae bacterium]|nr:MOSC domain-containing protein [Crocinitomicaceae bacterium]
MKIVSVNIGKKREVLLKGKIIETGIYKTQVNQAIFLDENHVKGDTIVDRVHHGGINQAVYGY